MAVLPKKIVFIPGEGFKRSEGSKCLYYGRVLSSWCESRSPIFKLKSSLKPSAIAFHAVVFGVHEAPCSTGRSSKGQLQR